MNRVCLTCGNMLFDRRKKYQKDGYCNEECFDERTTFIVCKGCGETVSVKEYKYKRKSFECDGYCSLNCSYNECKGCGDKGKFKDYCSDYCRREGIIGFNPYKGKSIKWILKNDKSYFLNTLLSYDRQYLRRDVKKFIDLYLKII